MTTTTTMQRKSSTRRLSLDMFQRGAAGTEKTTFDMGIFKYMDLRFPSTHQSSLLSNEVRMVECECCGLSEDCSGNYIRHTRARFFGKWVCGLCSEAVTEESFKLGRMRNIVHEEALNKHMEICRRFKKNIRANPAMSLASAMTQILRSNSKKNGRILA